MFRLLALSALFISLGGCATFDGLQDCKDACNSVFGAGGCLAGQAPAGSATACTAKCATLPLAEQQSTTSCLNDTSCTDPQILECVDLE
ncbi:MAG: hypothetical protein ACI9MC_000730 [Kiritimatiellia bacterium]|jgi:hypothetical protein